MYFSEYYSSFTLKKLCCVTNGLHLHLGLKHGHLLHRLLECRALKSRALRHTGLVIGVVVGEQCIASLLD